MLMLLVWLVAARLPAQEPRLTLEIRVFDGLQDVSDEARISLYKTGVRAAPVAVQEPGESPRFEFGVDPGLYDVQAIRERRGQVVGLRWAERLVVVAYPEERGRHIEVINLKAGFGALILRSADGSAPPWTADLFAAGARDHEAATPVRRAREVIFVAPPGKYDARITRSGNPVWLTDLEIPADRTQLAIVP